MNIDTKLLDELTAQAQSSPNFRMHYDLRNSSEDLSQRMLNAIEPDSVIPIHRHWESSETVIVIRGKIVELFFDETGQVLEDTFEVDPSGPCFGVNVPKGKWHTIKSLESGTVIVEFKDGPYEILQPEDIL